MLQTSKKPYRLAWLLGALLSTLLLCLMALFSRFSYAINDDSFVLRALMLLGSADGGVFHPYVHALYTWPLSWLGQAFPTVPWFSVLQLLLLWLANAATVKCLLICQMRNGGRLASGLLLALCYLALFSMRALGAITYTTTAALLGGAAVAQVMSLDIKPTDQRPYRGMLFAAVLAALSYGLRQPAGLAATAYCVAACVLQGVPLWKTGAERADKRRFLCAVLLAALIMSAMLLSRAWELHQQQNAMRWQDARTDVTDYMQLSDVSPELLQKVGWSESDCQLLMQWYTMDERYSTEAFEWIYALSDAAGRLTPGAALADLRMRSPLFFRSMLILGGICLGGLLLLAFGKGDGWRLSLASLLVAGGLCLLLTAYLAWQGRLPERAVCAAVDPAAAMIFCALSSCRPRFKGSGRIARAGGICLAALTLWYAIPAAQSVRYVPPKWDYDAYAELDAHALEHPDMLFLYGWDLSSDLRLFPDFTSGVPGNLMLWGGWQRGMPEYRTRLSNFGLDGEHFTAQDWFRPCVRLISVNGAPPEALIRYLAEQTGTAVRYQSEKVRNGLYVYRFLSESE